MKIKVNTKYNKDNDRNKEASKIMPLLKISDGLIKGTYYYDGSGEIGILNNRKYGDVYIFYEDSGLISDHILELEHNVSLLQRQIVLCKQALTGLKQAKKKAKL